MRNFLLLAPLLVLGIVALPDTLDDLPFSTTWLTAQQRHLYTEVDNTKKSEFLIDAYKNADEESKTKAQAETVPKCYSSWISEATLKELKDLHTTDHEECKKKVNDLLSEQPEEKRNSISTYLSFCEHLWYGGHVHTDDSAHHHHEGHQHRRHLMRHSRHIHASFDEFSKEHLTWLTPEQLKEVKDLHSTDGGSAKASAKVAELFKATEGETRTKAKAEIQAACKELLVNTVGEEKTGELKKLREAGASTADIQAKVESFLAEVTDPVKKEKAAHHKVLCQAAFQDAKRKRRDHHHGHEHGLEDYLKTHLSWLSDQQKEQLRQLKSSGHTDDQLRDKVLEFFDAATGDVKEQATAALQGGCRSLLVSVVGEDKVAELKALREGGKTNTEIYAKIKELIKTVEDKEKLAKLEKYKVGCKKAFGVSEVSRRRRQQHHHDLEAKFRSEWKWLTDEQKEEVRKLKTDGKNNEFILAKVFEFYEKASDKRDEAEDGLQTSCQASVLTILGTEKAEELKRFMENGAKSDAYEKKVAELLKQAEQAAPKKTLTKNQVNCKRVFATPARKRRDRPPHVHTSFDDFAEEHLTWLTAEQKEQVKALHAEGPTASANKVIELFKAAEGETKEKATAGLQAACKELIVNTIGEEKAGEIRKLKESGASPNEISTKIDTLLETVADGDNKKKALQYKPFCEVIFGAKRTRRDHHHHGHTLEDYLKTHLSWLNDEQKAEVRKLKEDGKGREEIQKAVMGFYESSTGEQKEKATAALQSGCRELLVSVIGAEKAGELKALKESGAAIADVVAKADEFIKAVGEDNDKVKAAKSYEQQCKKLFGVGASRRRRDHHEHHHHTLEDYLKTHLSWLTDEQKEQLKELKAAGKDKVEIQNSVLKFFDAATGEVKEKATAALQSGCRELIVHFLGKEKADELKKLKENGASPADLIAKGDALLNEITDDEKKAKAQFYSAGCRKVFGLSRKRRDHHEHHHTLEDLFKTHLSWLTDAQKEELRTLKADGKDKAALQAKTLEYYGQTTGDLKTKAREQLQGGCRELLIRLVGKEKADELKKLRESGASTTEIDAKATEFIATLTDEHAKKEAEEYKGTCRKLFQEE